ncbi:hypothetical protein GUJ93_ZPchr0012g19981 [Zizania palustris]|uniref:Uncharacterized protein n=1 Tax=Zizania palustris TaxID=103762 RepID=A0A8J5WNW0_ZIZPA|nr:hypothetical protein GUJ93_ZPchr0012g19981 [Zizania palustris]
MMRFFMVDHLDDVVGGTTNVLVLIISKVTLRHIIRWITRFVPVLIILSSNIFFSSVRLFLVLLLGHVRVDKSCCICSCAWIDQPETDRRRRASSSAARKQTETQASSSAHTLPTTNATTSHGIAIATACKSTNAICSQPATR